MHMHDEGYTPELTRLFSNLLNNVLKKFFGTDNCAWAIGLFNHFPC